MQFNLEGIFTLNSGKADYILENPWQHNSCMHFNNEVSRTTMLKF